jgi:hypothetical protein
MIPGSATPIFLPVAAGAGNYWSVKRIRADTTRARLLTTQTGTILGF